MRLFEFFSTKKTIILAGDSIFKNNNYVKHNQSVEYLVKLKHNNTISTQTCTGDKIQ